jgi:hypothetical protein
MINAISTSKIKKIIAIKKNRIENGSRAEFIGSKPHSKGDDFSRSIVAFLDRAEASPMTITLIKKIKVPIKKIKKIIYTNSIRLYNWKLYILIILYKFNYLISKLKYKGKVKPHLQNVNIKQRLQIQSDDYGRSEILYVELNKLVKR